MNILLAFAPFLPFALVDRALGPLGGGVVSIAMLVRDTMLRGKSPKVMEMGTVMLFAGLSAWYLAFHPAWSII
ncbi:MAG: hypothetical protein EOO23_06905 [Comamonadaceae bacterium]|nr:MAG: hypothetical protein EOO23_06905 [Comamonadaceae bacterium]